MKKQSALRMVDTRTLDRAQWLEVRKGGIGSSDAAAAVGLSPYKSQLELWMEKTGRTAAKEGNPGMQDPRFWGTLLEPYVAVAYMQKTDRKVRKINAVLQHPTFNFMLANIDREWWVARGCRFWSARPPLSSVRHQSRRQAVERACARHRLADQTHPRG